MAVIAGHRDRAV